ncbi:hypothetical protein P9139_14575 [Curtobacterium flaccumfaciens]|nr:hypothetical protein P9139_14575 [Curtobacterium flaccumfaciens]
MGRRTRGGVLQRPRRRPPRRRRTVPRRPRPRRARGPPPSRVPEFERRWDTGRVAEHRTSRKRVHSPVGPIEIDCDVLSVPGGDLRIVVYTAVPGTEDAAKLKLLRVTGLQTLAPTS